MKKLFTVLLGAVILYACDTATEVLSDDNIIKAKSESEIVGSFASVEDLFEFLVDQTADIEISEDEILEGQLSYTIENGEVTLLTLEQKEADFFIIHGIKVGEAEQPFQVSCCCDTEGREFFETYCDAVASCGGLIVDCLQHFACESACTATFYFHPKTGYISIAHSTASEK
ncbi:MAG: hypothetical protein LAT76_13425 [Schleiferiaceae bacterium]|nr:hypothetical protein [Schleiferiaceae bacterium]